jgi:hypothetical protein
LSSDGSIRNEKDVENLLVKPILIKLGWRLDKSNCQVWIALTDEKALLWNYSPKQKRMCRDYVLRDVRSELHVEAKHRWEGWKLDIDALLARLNVGNFSGTERDGSEKDLALLLWGAQSQGSRRAAVMDESWLMVFHRDNDWRISAHARLDDLASFVEAADLLKPVLA